MKYIKMKLHNIIAWMLLSLGCINTPVKEVPTEQSVNEATEQPEPDFANLVIDAVQTVPHKVAFIWEHDPNNASFWSKFIANNVPVKAVFYQTGQLLINDIEVPITKEQVDTLKSLILKLKADKNEGRELKQQKKLKKLWKEITIQ